MAKKKKIGRNDPCPCGSGKKFKRCCLDSKPTPRKRDKHYFSLKGKDSERFVQELSENTFLTDWCYPNPKRPNGKELCDLLIVFDDIAIIWQIKDTKLAKDGAYRPQDIKKNVSQISGAYRQLFEIEAPIELENPRRGTELFDRSRINRVFLISCLMGDVSEFFCPVDEVKNRSVHVFNRTFTEIVLNELDTITDFVQYLEEKEKLLKQLKTFFVIGGEQELLAYYLVHSRSFDDFMNLDMLTIEEGCWDRIVKEETYINRKKEDEVSYYVWDDIINATHTGDNPEYEKCAREFARTSRFERRILSQSFRELQLFADTASEEAMPLRTMSLNDVTYVFMFVHPSKPKKSRNEILANTCLVARMRLPNKKVIGIATESIFMPLCTYSFCYLEIDELSNEQLKLAKEIQDFMGIMKGEFQNTGTIYEFKGLRAQEIDSNSQ